MKPAVVLRWLVALPAALVAAGLARAALQIIQGLPGGGSLLLLLRGLPPPGGPLEWRTWVSDVLFGAAFVLVFSTVAPARRDRAAIGACAGIGSLSIAVAVLSLTMLHEWEYALSGALTCVGAVLAAYAILRES